MRSICWPLDEVKPPRWRLEPRHRWAWEPGRGGRRQDAPSRVLESPPGRTPFPGGGWPPRDAAAVPRRRHTGMEGGCSCCAKALAVEIPRDPPRGLGDALGSHRQWGGAGPHHPRGWDLGGSSCFPVGWGKATCLAGDPGGPGDPRGNPAATPPACPIPLSQQFRAQQPYPMSLPALPLPPSCRRHDDKTKMNGPSVSLCLSASCLIN